MPDHISLRWHASFHSIPNMVFCGKAPHCQNYLEVSLKYFPLCLCFINLRSTLTPKTMSFFILILCGTRVCDRNYMNTLFWNPILSIWLQGDCLAVVLFLDWHGMKRKWPKFISGWLADASASPPLITDTVKARDPLLYLTLITVYWGQFYCKIVFSLNVSAFIVTIMKYDYIIIQYTVWRKSFCGCIQ